MSRASTARATVAGRPVETKAGRRPLDGGGGLALTTAFPPAFPAAILDSEIDESWISKSLSSWF
jgi:hypothetical protein